MSSLALPVGPGKNASLYASDIVAAAATDTAISAITWSAEDRLLINAVLSNRAATSTLPSPWVTTQNNSREGLDTTAAQARQPSASSANYALANEATLAGTRGTIVGNYRKLLDREDALRTQGCTSAAAKAAFSAADELINSLNTPADKTGVTPLTAAMQAEYFVEKTPLILRLAIEQTGGTAITRSGIIYTLGFPNAATVSSGLVVSFRLVDPASGQLKLTGIVRCAVPPQNLKKVAKLTGSNTTQTICSYRAA